MINSSLKNKKNKNKASTPKGTIPFQFTHNKTAVFQYPQPRLFHNTKLFSWAIHQNFIKIKNTNTLSSKAKAKNYNLLGNKNMAKQ